MGSTGTGIGMGWSAGAGWQMRGRRVRQIVATVLMLCACLLLGHVAHAATEEDFLPPEKAFQFAAKQLDPQTIEVRFDVADGYYMYRERFAFATQPATVKLGPPALPQGQVHFDENFGKNMETYRGSVVVRVPVIEAPADGRWSLVVTSQGCADKGLCYPPMESVYKVGGSVLGNLFGDRTSPVPSTQAPATPEQPAAAGKTSPVTTGAAPPRDDNDRIAGALASRNLGLIAALFFGLGLLLTFTPCVLPMVPILSSIVVGEHVTRGRARLVSPAKGFPPRCRTRGC